MHTYYPPMVMAKKIVILSAFLSPMRSGAEACAEEVPLALADRLVRHSPEGEGGYRFTIVTAKMRSDLPRKDMLQGKVPVVRVGFGFFGDKWLFPFLAPLAVRTLQPDIIHAVLETFAGLALVFCKFVCPKAKRMLTCQTTNRKFLKGYIVRSPDIVTAISTHLVSEIHDRYRRNRVVRIPNGIHLHVFEQARDRVQKVPGRVLFVGRLEPQKGVDILLRAFAQISAGAHLRIVGSGSQRRALENLVTDLGIVDRVQFVGCVAPDQIADEFAQAEIFCGLSRSEALGNVFLEAQAGGCAVVATNIGGIPDIVEDGKTGLLIAPDNITNASVALTKLLSEPELRKRMAQAGVHYSQFYDWTVIAEQYAKIYES